ncbi:hypothetical protein C5N14_30605 [Micromonospora sp. MW-13]|uniref:hypothetical protein n=1 Tax=Micromonospora sp. MW-13 TaxID=2094022 RepID=UPI000EE98C2F|nr:hypothetical protein [Micromonospora sp. MW-13]RGC65055.1 hypothetical protein C5N14_30605 [Micromonospora sp. MW-13]
MRKYARQWPNRVWAIEGCQGIGRHIANRLLADGEQIVDVPPKLSARAQVFATGQGRKATTHRLKIKFNRLVVRDRSTLTPPIDLGEDSVCVRA